jgi:hypothetical protein
MSKRTIAKFFVFVILIPTAGFTLSGCGRAWSSGRQTTDFDRAQSPYTEPRVIGKIESPDITESSGLAASKCQPGVLWTHNDSGDGPYLYAMDEAGKNLGTWRVTGAENRDWEDIDEFKDASGQCFLYIGEIGNNEGKRERTLVYRVKEPQISTESRGTNKKNALSTEPTESVRVDYPGPRENAEALLVHPKTGDIYIVSKRFSGPAAVYRVPQQFGSEQPVAAIKIADITVPSVPNGLLTGGDISPDGTRVALSDYTAGYELTLPKGDPNFDDIWKQQPVKFDIGKRETGESIAYSPDGLEVFAGSEGRNSPIYEIRKK